MKLRIAFVLFPQFEELDFAGPFEVFGMAAKYIDKEWSVFTVGEEPVVKGFLGAAIQVDHTFADAPVADIAGAGVSGHAVEYVRESAARRFSAAAISRRKFSIF